MAHIFFPAVDFQIVGSFIVVRFVGLGTPNQGDKGKEGGDFPKSCYIAHAALQSCCSRNGSAGDGDLAGILILPAVLLFDAFSIFQVREVLRMCFYGESWRFIKNGKSQTDPPSVHTLQPLGSLKPYFRWFGCTANQGT